MRRIYLAGPLHQKEDRERNAKITQTLRRAGHKVYVPQEHGIWEDLVERFEGDITKTRQFLYRLDIDAMHWCDTIVACCDGRSPSEGMLWEMGWGAGANKTVLLLNASDYKYNLMPKYGCLAEFDSLDTLVDFLEEQK